MRGELMILDREIQRLAQSRAADQRVAVEAVVGQAQPLPDLDAPGGVSRHPVRVAVAPDELRQGDPFLACRQFCRIEPGAVQHLRDGAPFVGHEVRDLAQLFR